ncbi:MAG: 30S ribosomal protein S4 [Elusimicrobiota bacterium]
MARLTTARCRICRRFGEKLFLKGAKCTAHCTYDKKERQKQPGQHGGKRRGKMSNYAVRLNEKQKARAMSGILESQFRKMFREAAKKKGLTGTNLLIIMETRLDNVLYRLGISTSRSQARQYIVHGHVKVNKHRVNKPSYIVKLNDEITVSDKIKSTPQVKRFVDETSKDYSVPTWLSLDAVNLVGKMVSIPTREQISYPVAEQLIIEFYSR